MQNNLIDFWNHRHGKLGLYSGGDKGISDHENFEFYVYRLSVILKLISKYNIGKRPLDVLDAGCGKGFFSNGLFSAGYFVTGIDSSINAINYCKERYPDIFFKQGNIDSCFLYQAFDVIICIDVMFHIVEDSSWEKSIKNLAYHAKNNSIIIISDCVDAVDNEKMIGEKVKYIKYRNKEKYSKILELFGFYLKNIVSYEVLSNKNSFMVFQRKG
ncbi:class I SAM-dependent methyltransferase [Campylobacter sp. IFREMER_LSEM_CL2256]|uniref:class I SAM-dependent methyltransferase n=1 Tax=Campylobacter sp. IFREMER_LSEM_CL2256 TaxID=2911622 RepID=UPI0021E730A6|nr:class I SAM-dependent methyltransferase [Campylobacter sp. IFREMER_LSEM_CL2256]MCV3387086.1 class I SAM-dependent methyltransferase [Campylobacter sp. IFREMER_LSEM_CL2256]